MNGHNHSETCSCAHEAKEMDIDYGDTLYSSIETINIRALNTEDDNTASHPFKPHNKRLDETLVLKSDEDDGDLIIHIPFTCQVILKSFCIIGGSNETAPKSIKMWKNREDIDFGNVNEVPETQKFDLTYDIEGNIWYPTRVIKFQNISNLTLFFENDNQTQINYIGLKGKSTKNKKNKSINIVYESQANPADHNKITEHNKSTSFSGM